MIFRRRSRLAGLVARQLDLWLADNEALVADVEDALRAYDRADADEATELYERYLDLVETGREGLADVRDAYARTLDEVVAAEYEEEFERAVRKRLRRFGLELDV